MKYSSRFFLYAPLGVFAVLVLIVGIRWWVMADALSDKLAAANGHTLMPGVGFAFETRTITGFPFSLDTQFHNVTFTLQTPGGTTRWQAEKFASHALTYGRDEMIYEAAGHQSLTWVGPDGGTRTLVFAVGSLRASAILKAGVLSRFDLDLIGFGSQAFTAQRLQFHARQSPRDRLDIKAMLLAPRPAAGLCPLLDPRIAQIDLEAALDQAAALDGLLGGLQDWQAALAHMHKAGGGVRYLYITFRPQNGVAPATLNTKGNLRSAAAVPAEALPEVAPLIGAVCGS